MPRLKSSQRERLIIIFKKNKHFILSSKNKWEILRLMCLKEDIVISAQSIRRIIYEFLKTGRVLPKTSNTGRIKKTKITLGQIRQINQLVNKNRELTGLQIKNQLNLNVSPRSVRRYINFLGWRKIKTRF